MKWPWNRARKELDVREPGRDSEAVRAQERARLAKREAEINLAEMKGRSHWQRNQLATNNFAGEIWNAMKRRPQ